MIMLITANVKVNLSSICLTEEEEMWLPIKGKRITRQQFYALVEMVDIAQPK